MVREYFDRATNAIRPRDVRWVNASRTSIGTSTLQVADANNRYYLVYVMVNNGDGNPHTVRFPGASGPFYGELMENGGTLLMNLSGAEHASAVNTALTLNVADAWAAGGDAGTLYVAFGFLIGA